VRNALRFLLAIALIAMPLLSASSSAHAQSAQQIAQITSSLSPESQKVIERLSSFDKLKAEQWHYHAGDLPHGEALNLDDSNWPIVKAGSEAPNDAVWYRREVEVPKTLNGYDLTGARIWFAFHANANGPMPQIIYFNGRRVALGDDLEPIVLFDQAKPGDKVLIAVKLLHTIDKKTFRGTTLKIDFASGRPNPEDLRAEFLSSTLLVPTLSKNAPQDLATLQHAIATVDLGALDANDQSKFDASLTQASQQLGSLKPMLQQATFHVTGNSHIDAAWLWPWTETVDVVKRTFGTALQLMNEYPDYTYTQSAAQYNSWMANKYPQMNDEIKQRIKEGRWEVVGGMWVEPDLNMPGGESTVRSILIGKRWYKQHYGVDVRIGWNPDSFGYNWRASPDLQAFRHRLLRHSEDDLERHQPAPLQNVLVGVARRQQSANVLPGRLRQQRSEPDSALRRPGSGPSARSRHGKHNGSLRHWRPRWRPHPRRPRRGRPLGATRQDHSEDALRHLPDLLHQR